MKKIIKIISFTGIWAYILVVLTACMGWGSLVELLNISGKAEQKVYVLIFILPVFLPILIISYNYRKWKEQGFTDFGIAELVGRKEVDEYSTKEYLKAAYPPLDASLLDDAPKDLCLGMTQDKRYVNVPIKRDGLNMFVCGGVGSGKSVMIIGWLLARMFGRWSETNWNFFLVDIKGEIFRKILRLKGPYRAADYQNIQVVEPSNRESYGWDVLYRVHQEGVNDTARLKAVMDITEAMIPDMGSEGNSAYFNNNAKKLFSGILFFYVKNYPEKSFVEIIHSITRCNLAELLERIVKEAKERFDTITLDKLQSFVGKESNESMQDIEATMQQLLDVFSYPDIEYMLEINPHKTSPKVLNDGVTSIDLAIEESMLLVYKPIFRLITLQILRHCESDFKETDERHTILIVDEAARVGKVEGLPDAMATLRSRHTSIALLFQDISQMKSIYHDIADSILNLSELKIFLSGSGDQASTEYVARMAGEYVTASKNYKKGSFVIPQSDVNYHDDRRPIIDGKSFMSLREKGEMIIFYLGHYYRLKKLKYYEDPAFQGLDKDKVELVKTD